SGEDRIVAYVVPDRRAAYHLRKRLERPEGSLLELPDGRAVAHLNPSETRFMYEEIFERGAYERHGVEIGDGAVVFDVGANIGLFSLYASDSARNVTIHAFEPMPEVFAALKANQTLHGFQGKLHPVALGSKPGREEFVYYPNVSVLSGRFADSDEERRVVMRFLENEGRGRGDETLLGELLEERLEARRFECEIRTLSEVIRESGCERIDLLKIDVEKSELEVLLGIEDQDWARIQQIVVEVHDEGDRLETIEKLLSRHGFQLEVDQDPSLVGTGLYNVYAVKAGGRTGGKREAVRAFASLEEVVESLRKSASSKLPDYMVPASFVLLPELPLTAHGKVDLSAIPESDGRKIRRAERSAPRNDSERALAAVWCEVLGLDEVSPDDNFFEVGGDSILSIQVVSRARKAGWKISPKDIFRFQTVSELAAAAKPVQPMEAAAPISDPSLLTPIQRWFFDLELVDPHHFNHAVLLEIADGASAERMASAITEIAARHDVFRLRFEPGSAGPVTRFDDDARLALAFVDLSALPSEERANALERAAESLQKSLDLSKGPLARAAWFGMGEESESRLLLICHHLVVDGVSWRLLLEEIARGCEGAAAEEISKAGSYRAWAGALARYARSAPLREELSYWKELAAERPLPFPKDRASSAEEDLFESVESAALSLDREQTAALLEVPSNNRVQVTDVLVTALLATLGPWSGNRRFLIDLESHGREAIENVDPASIVGWLTSIFPVLLRYEPAASLDEMLDTVKEQLGRVPRNGIGFGVLRYLSSFEGAEELRSIGPAELIFNYLGRFQSKGPSRAALRTLPGGLGPTRNPKARRHHPIEVTALISGEELRIEWTYSSRAYERGTMERLARGYVSNLRAILSRSRLVAGEALYSAADFGGRTSSAALEKAQEQVDFE
ncbi:MAG: FkbM family methyltransferase, partial [Vicinamibacteria bacterium]